MEIFLTFKIYVYVKCMLLLLKANTSLKLGKFSNKWGAREPIHATAAISKVETKRDVDYKKCKKEWKGMKS